MKLSHFKSLFLLVVISFFASCGGDDDKKKTTRYYVEFKMPEKVIYTEVNEPEYSSCENCVCTQTPQYESVSAELAVCKESGDFTANDIVNLLGEELTFEDDVYPHVILHFRHDGVDYSSTNIPSQLGSFMVTDVVSEGTSDGFALYKVTGNFECLVKANESVMAFDLIEGKFVLRFAVE